jgi:hypothetical protein
MEDASDQETRTASGFSAPPSPETTSYTPASTVPSTSFTPSSLNTPTIHITTHNASGQATLHSSQENESTPYPGHNFAATTIYTTSSMPVDMEQDRDIAQHEAVIEGGQLGIVQRGGTVCRFVDFGPGSMSFMHRTQSLDYGVVIEGNVILALDDGSVTLLRRGDVAVQRATTHAWRNASRTEWARMFFVFQDCMPIGPRGEGFQGAIGSAPKAEPASSANSEQDQQSTP